MPATSSFDVTSPIDFQEVDNALNQARKEVGQRYDFKGSKSDFTLNAGEKTLTLVSDDEFKMNALWEIVQTRLVRRGVQELSLRPKEFDLLAALVRHRGRVVSRADLLREVWGYAPGTESRTVETHLAALRERLGDDPQAPRYIVTVRRAGYRIGV